MSGWLTRANARKVLTYRPAPKPLVALCLSLRWRAIVSPSADITYPFRLRLGRGVRLGRCRIHCSGPVTLGDGVFIHDGVILNASGGEIVVGDRVEINPYCVLYGMGGLHIGRDTGVAAHTVMVTANHGIDDLDVPMMRQPSRKLGVSVAENVWIGAGCVILDGVSVGEGAVVAAGAVVTRDVGREDVVGGVPARVLKNRRAGAVESPGRETSFGRGKRPGDACLRP